MTSKQTQQSLSHEELAFAEIIGDLIEKWGFNRNLGRVWSFLYLRAAAHSPVEIQNALSMSVGNLNMSLNELQRWGVIRRVRIAGVRSFYYEAEPYIWKSVTNVLQSRELRLLANAELGLTHLQDTLKKQRRPKEEIARVAHVHEAVSIAAALLNQVLSVDPRNLARIAKLVSKLKSL